MKVQKLIVNKKITSHIEKVLEALGNNEGITNEEANLIRAQGCGGICHCSCSWYCESTCSESCMGTEWLYGNKMHCRLKDYGECEQLP
jgi:hypothetical protein